MAQSGLLEARIISGDGQVTHAGGSLSQPIVVEVTDETGMHVDGAIVSFRLPEDGISGTFKNGLKTEILRTDEGGRAALHSLTCGGLAGQFQVRLTVAKGQARTGSLSTQFIAPGTSRSGWHMGPLRPSKRVVEIGALVLAVAVAGYVKQSRSGSSSSNVSVPPTIGPPTVSVGKP